MSLDTDSLRKVLELEKKKGYQDAAVIGGLDRFLRNWSVQALKLGGPALARRLGEIGLSSYNYALLSQAKRKAWTDELLRSLAGLEAGDFQDNPVTPPAKKQPESRSAEISPADANLDSAITVLRGISAATAVKFKKLGVVTIRDLLYFFPHRHLDYSQRKYISQLEIGREETVIANVWQAQRVLIRGRPGTEAVVGDETGNIRVVWFNNPYLSRTLKTNDRIVISGRVSQFNRWPVFESPE
ncbi:MAG: DNA helicase RecG, partial [Dehalococcoidales bacterium]